MIINVPIYTKTKSWESEKKKLVNEIKKDDEGS
jgi:hypothetical protein